MATCSLEKRGKEKSSGRLIRSEEKASSTKEKGRVASRRSLFGFTARKKTNDHKKIGGGSLQSNI